MTFGSEATSVAVDADDNVFVYCRGPIPVLVFDRHGELIDSWGGPDLGVAHAITADATGRLLLTDMRHAIHIRSADGRPLQELGTQGKHSPPHSGEPFNIPTDAVVRESTGEIFVTDGYRNSSVHRFSPEGAHLSSFGRPGQQPGEFALPHGAAFVDDQTLLVCDRENYRIQVFGVGPSTLEPIAEWHAFYPQCLRVVDDRGPHSTGAKLVLVGEGPPTTYMHNTPNIGSRVAVFTPDGTRVGTVGAGGWGYEPDHFTSIHGVAMDSAGDLYVAEATHAVLTRYYKEEAPGGELISMRKWARCSPDMV
jgi:hypothetical protein